MFIYIIIFILLNYTKKVLWPNQVAERFDLLGNRLIAKPGKAVSPGGGVNDLIVGFFRIFIVKFQLDASQIFTA